TEYPVPSTESAARKSPARYLVLATRYCFPDHPIPVPSQLLATKSIDKLISDSEQPEHRLKKSLGPWSLTALGIGAIIGSGIFVLTGTAAAGEHFEVPSLLHAQVMDLIVNLVRHGTVSGVIMHGR